MPRPFQSDLERLLRLTYAREEDGRWIAEAAGLPGVLAYGDSRKEAGRLALSLALRVLADQVEATPL